MRKLIAKFLTWALQDQTLCVGSLRIKDRDTIYVDTVDEETAGAGVQVKKLRPDSGTETPSQFPGSPTVGQKWFATDTLKEYVFVGIGQPGANAAGWFNVKNAHYAA